MKQFYIYTQDDKKYRVDLDEYSGDVMQIAVQMSVKGKKTYDKIVWTKDKPESAIFKKVMNTSGVCETIAELMEW